MPEPVEADRSRQVAALLYTSGTTGNPRGVMLTHRNVLFSARVVGSQRGVTPADKAYCVLPISHIVGYSAILIASLMFGCTVQIVLGTIRPLWSPPLRTRASPCCSVSPPPISGCWNTKR